MSREIWARLGADMRALRVNAGVSLRQAEARSGWGRGTLSQVENGKARPSRALVEWYESEFAGDELLLSTYAEARGARRDERRTQTEQPFVLDGDAFEYTDPLLPHGALVRVGQAVTVGWTLRNTGAVPWRGRHLRRLGAHAASQLITSPPTVPIDECASGEAVGVRFEICLPAMPGTLAAYWQMVDGEGRPCFALPHLLSTVVVVR